MTARQRGFTLIEVVLAFALLSVGLGLLVAIQGGGLRQVYTAADVGEATQHAQSLLDALGVMERLQPGRDQGAFEGGRYRWELDIQEVPDPAPPGQAPAASPGEGPAEDAPDPGVGLGLPDSARPRLFRIVLEVRWGQGEYQRVLRFATLRARQPQLAEAAP